MRNLSLTCTKLYGALSELTNSEATVTFPGPMEVFVMQHPIIIWFDNIFVLCHIAIFETCWTLNISLHRYLFKGLYWVWKFNLEIFFLNSHLTTSQKSKIHRSAPFMLNNGQDIHLVSCRIETLSRQPEYKVGRIKVGGGEDGPVSYANSCGHFMQRISRVATLQRY